MKFSEIVITKIDISPYFPLQPTLPTKKKRRRSRNYPPKEITSGKVSTSHDEGSKCQRTKKKKRRKKKNRDSIQTM